MERIFKKPYKRKWYTIMDNDCSQTSNAEQFVICFNWVDEYSQDYDDVIGLCNVHSINSETQFYALEDILL